MKNVEVSIDIHVPPSNVIDSFTDADLLRRWWGVEKSFIDLRRNGVYTVAWLLSGDGMKYISTGIISDFDPHRKLHIENYMYLSAEKEFLGPMELKIDAIATENGSRVHLSQGPYPERKSEDWDWYYDAVNSAWPNVMLTLKEFLEN